MLQRDFGEHPDKRTCKRQGNLPGKYWTRADVGLANRCVYVATIQTLRTIDAQSLDVQPSFILVAEQKDQTVQIRTRQR